MELTLRSMMALCNARAPPVLSHPLYWKPASTPYLLGSKTERPISSK